MFDRMLDYFNFKSAAPISLAVSMCNRIYGLEIMNIAIGLTEYIRSSSPDTCRTFKYLTLKNDKCVCVCVCCDVHSLRFCSFACCFALFRVFSASFLFLPLLLLYFPLFLFT